MKPAIEYAVPQWREPSLARSLGVLAPATVAVAAYAAAILTSGAESAATARVLSYVLTALFVAAECATAVLARRWWQLLHNPAKGGALVVLVVGALFLGFVLAVNLGLVDI